MKHGILLVILLVAMIALFSISSLMPSGNRYVNAVRLGGEWFLNNQDEYFLHYQYNPYEGVHPELYHSLRSMGALWSITRLHEFTGDQRYKSLADRGIRYFEGYFNYDSDNDFIYVDISPDKIKLGYSAFMILSLLESDHPRKDYYMEKLAKGIMYMQNQDGSLRTFFYSNQSTGVDYYPGESLLALMSLYEHTGEISYLETVEKAFPYYADYWRSNRNTAFIPWQSRAYCKLFRQTGDMNVSGFIFEMNDYMLDEYSPQANCSGFDFSGGIVIAVHMEGVIQAHSLARDLGDHERAECYARFIKECSDSILSLQITELDGLDIQALGGFLGSQDSDTMRVDRNQHATMSIIEAYEAGILTS